MTLFKLTDQHYLPKKFINTIFFNINLEDFLKNLENTPYLYNLKEKILNNISNKKTLGKFIEYCEIISRKKTNQNVQLPTYIYIYINLQLCSSNQYI